MNTTLHCRLCGQTITDHGASKANRELHAHLLAEHKDAARELSVATAKIRNLKTAIRTLREDIYLKTGYRMNPFTS